MLEAEQYGDAKRLLQFLLQCQGEEQRNYEEWGNLLAWLEMAFPDIGEDASGEGEEPSEEQLRSAALGGGEQDESYLQQVLYIMKNHPMLDQQLLALERAAHLRSPEVDIEIRPGFKKSGCIPSSSSKRCSACASGATAAPSSWRGWVRRASWRLSSLRLPLRISRIP